MEWWVIGLNNSIMGGTNVHGKAYSGQLSVAMVGLVEKCNEKICQNRWFTIRMLSDALPHTAKTVLWGT